MILMQDLIKAHFELEKLPSLIRTQLKIWELSIYRYMQINVQNIVFMNTVN